MGERVVQSILEASHDAIVAAHKSVLKPPKWGLARPSYQRWYDPGSSKPLIPKALLRPAGLKCGTDILYPELSP